VVTSGEKRGRLLEERRSWVIVTLLVAEERIPAGMLYAVLASSIDDSS